MGEGNNLRSAKGSERRQVLMVGLAFRLSFLITVLIGAYLWVNYV